MDNKDKIIQEQREEIRLLNEEIKCLQLLLSQAGIPYGKGIQEKESRILRPGKQDIIRNAGITGSRVFVRNMKKRK